MNFAKIGWILVAPLCSTGWHVVSTMHFLTRQMDDREHAAWASVDPSDQRLVSRRG